MNIKHSRNLISAVREEELKSSLLDSLSTEHAEVAERLIYQAVNEAAALASLTSVPLLVLPGLAEEKARKAAEWSARQRSMLRSSAVAFAA